MRRKLRKLTLTRETLHDLAAHRLEGAVGGVDTLPLTCAADCSLATGRCCTDTCRPCRP